MYKRQGDLLMVGRSTERTMKKLGICTIGDLAGAEPSIDVYKRQAVRCGLFLFEQQMKLVDIVPCRLAFAAVYGNSVPNLILDNAHTEF